MGTAFTPLNEPAHNNAMRHRNPDFVHAYKQKRIAEFADRFAARIKREFPREFRIINNWFYEKQPPRSSVLNATRRL
jgi:hypothetical protein